MAKAKSSYSRGRGIGLLRQAPGAPRDTVCAGGGDVARGKRAFLGREHRRRLDADHHTWTPLTTPGGISRGRAAGEAVSLRSSRFLDHGGGCGQEGMMTRSVDSCLPARWKWLVATRSP